jgi:hypothetical protein
MDVLDNPDTGNDISPSNKPLSVAPDPNDLFDKLPNGREKNSVLKAFDFLDQQGYDTTAVVNMLFLFHLNGKPLEFEVITKVLGLVFIKILTLYMPIFVGGQITSTSEHKLALFEQNSLIKFTKSPKPAEIDQAVIVLKMQSILNSLTSHELTDKHRSIYKEFLFCLEI